MKKKGQYAGLIFLYLFLFAIIVFAVISTDRDVEKDCNKYKNEYGLNTKLVGDVWSFSGQTCYIVTKEGLMIDYKDVNIAQVYDFRK